MHDVLQQRQEAKTQLQAAKIDFAGHRTKAIHHIDAAIAQLQLVINQP
jgi:hypothetical protein